MQIRSVTLFAEPDWSPCRALAFFEQARTAFPVPVQTTRAALPPFPAWLDAESDVTVQAAAVEAEWRKAGADYISLGPVRLDDDGAWLSIVPTLIAAGETLFGSAEVADRTGQLDLGRCFAVAELILEISRLQANGFGNLFFCATANCGPGIPFFPAAYHGGGPAGFAIAVEGADLALQAIQGSRSLAEARTRLAAVVEEAAGQIAWAAEALAVTHELPFQGIDFTLAPFPETARSIGAALEALGLAPAGGPGSLFGAAFLTEALGRSRFPRVGFSGLMFPILEDAVLAARNAERQIGASELLSYAAVCGVGIDLLPLPGDVSRDSLAGLLMDMAALALRLDKPLTARIMPLPGLQAGDPVHFDFDYFADSRVNALAPVKAAAPILAGGRLPLRRVRDDEGRRDR